MKIRLLAAAVIILVLAGCLNDNNSLPDNATITATPTSSEDSGCRNCGNVSTPTLEKRVELVDCTTYFLTFPVDTEKMASLTPPGYEISSTPPLLGLDLYRCASAIIGNSTVIDDFQWFTVGGVVNTPNETNYDSGTDIFHLESCMNSPQVRELFALHGFPTCFGTVEILPSAPFVTITASIDGQVAYFYEAVGQVDEPVPPRGERLRIHTGNPPAWFTVDDLASNPDLPGELGTMKATAGVIPRVWISAGESTIARGGIGKIDRLINFESSVNT